MRLVRAYLIPDNSISLDDTFSIGMKIGIVAAEFNEKVTSKMTEKAIEKTEELGANYEIIEVPGVYDTVLPAEKLARKRDVDAVVVIGAIVKGDTKHDEIIGHAVAQKLKDVELKNDKPVTLGVTGPGMNGDEARDRTHYGANAVEAAYSLVSELEGQ